MLRTVGHVPGSAAEREWHGTLSRAFADIGNKTYVIADAVTHAPITPFAPIPGRVGIGADIAREFPGMRALQAGDVAPDVRRGRIAYHANAAVRFRQNAAWGEGHGRGRNVQNDRDDAARHDAIADAIRREFAGLRGNAFA